MVTTPEAEVMVPLPRRTPPLVIVMVPVGPVGTDAVMETVWPKMLGPEVVTVSVGDAFATTCVNVAMDVLLLASPL